MLARYNEFNTIKKPTEEAKGETKDLMQIGQGSQTIDNFGLTPNCVPHFTPFANENLRYKQLSIKDSFMKDSNKGADKNSTHGKYWPFLKLAKLGVI